MVGMVPMPTSTFHLDHHMEILYIPDFSLIMTTATLQVDQDTGEPLATGRYARLSF